MPEDAARSKMGLQIGDIMTREVATVGPHAKIVEAAKVMSEREVGMLPVLEEDRVVGVVTDRNITVRAVAEGLDSNQAEVAEIMTTEIVYCYDDEEIEEAIDSMEECQIRRLVVLNRDHGLEGVLSVGDIAVDTGNNELAGEVLRKVSEPDRDDRDVHH